MNTREVQLILESANEEISGYLETALKDGRIDQQLYDEAEAHTFNNLRRWLNDVHIDAISPRLKEGICRTVEEWEGGKDAKDLKKGEEDRKKKIVENLVNAFRQSVRFGTGGIRGLMAFDKNSIIRLKEEGIDAPILKGPNTINDLVFLLTSVGVAKFGKDQKPPFEKVVIGYDSRIGGHDLAAIVAQLFLAYDYAVYFFDAPCPYPEVTFAIPNESVKADVGILISASHNDYRYNGYKLSCSNGSQFDPEERDEMYEKYIAAAEPKEIKLLPFKQAGDGKLWFLGGSGPVSEFDYAGRERFLIDIHEKHREHVKSFLLTDDLAERQQSASNALRIAYCAFHGSGNVAVPRLLKEVGFSEVKIITHNGLNDLNGLFPSFCNDEGREQQPDPGDPRAAKIAVDAFKAEYGGEFEHIDILIGTDPDADRCGVVVKVPQSQRHLHRGEDYYLLPADDMWTLVLWYRLHREIEKYGRVKEADKKFVTLSHTTSDSITRLARKHGLGVVRSWVGFAALAAATRDMWDGKADQIAGLVDGRDQRYRDVCHPFVCDCQGMEGGNRTINVASMEQSNGFSILGGPPPDKNSLGAGGHVRDKDGTFAALLIAEIAAYAKDKGTSLIELLDEHIYLDPDVGLFVALYEPDPLDGEYPGIEGDRLKKAILRRALGYFQLALSGDLEIAGLPVKSACIYRTGKYDAIYPPSYDFQFPDEGVRFFFDDEKLNHVTIRPSGTGNALRFHIQLHTVPTKSNLVGEKEKLFAIGRAVMNDIRELLKAPRSAEREGR
ncbi:MAG: phosphohexomutase domain-containing protein [Planctomycetota bacterium]|jgi:phosphoglucomutase